MIKSTFSGSVNVECFRYRENSNNYYDKHMKITVSVVKDGEVFPLHYLIDTNTAAWVKATVRIMDWKGDFSVQVEGETTGSPSDLTLDDITFDNCGLPSLIPGECPMYHLKCPYTGICIPPSFICDTTNDCGNQEDEKYCEGYPAICTLEEDEECDWTQENEQDDIDWHVGMSNAAVGSTSHLTGPPADHTTRLTTGHYLYITSPPHHNNMEEKQSKKTYRAWFVSPTLMVEPNFPVPCQLRFHYYMYGKNIEELNVYTRTEIYGKKSLSFRRLGEQGQFWDRSVVTATELVYFQFIIEGITNNKDFSNLAIDDLSWTGSCLQVNASLPDGSTPTPPPSPCADDEFYCGYQSACISASKRCDWHNDCKNNADEEFCGECSFEYGLCDWYDASAGMFQWRRISASAFSYISHPNVDHTYNTSEGHYIYLENGVGIDGKTAILNSPKISHMTGPYCELHFWLYVEKPANSNLTLYTYQDQIQGQLLYTLLSHEVQEKVWFKVIATAANVPMNDYFVFKVTPTFDPSTSWEETHSSLAIDDISFFNCNDLTLSLNCNFDNEDLCTWQQDTSDEQDWTKTGINNGSLADHTSGSGYYVSIDFIQPQGKMTTNDKARLISTVQSKPDKYKNVLSLWYYFYGENVGSFRIIERKESTKTNSTLFEVTTTQEDRWLLYQEEMVTDDDFTIILEGEWGERGMGLLAVDDILMKSNLNEAVCGFEGDFCQWLPSNESAGVWTRGQGQQNLTVLPPVDHTHGADTGYYVYLKATGQGEVGFLTSPTYKTVGIQCIRFWYHMLGDNVGHLKVEIDEKTVDYGFIPLWTHSENTFEMWFQGMVTLPDMQKYSVRFMGISGANQNTVLALDDVTFVPGACPQPYVCNFEYDTCEWFNSDRDEFDWVLSSGEEGGGILVDHTVNYETGHYLVTKLEGKKKGDHAQLFGPVVPARHKCMTFWYSMQHIVNATLIVNLMQDETIDLVKLHNSSLLYLWEEISITPDVSSDSYEITLDLVVDEDITFSEFFTIAIDDIAFTEDCDTHTHPHITTQPPTHLPSTYDCDFEQDESETCGWMQESDDGIDWQRCKGSTPTPRLVLRPTTHFLMSMDTMYIVAITWPKMKPLQC
ncbi:MAM and LDL-receptor class A domain-containing protein 2 [Chionoecetes opilio]|uniref:MAM and LDL-receptor class A domain-containing protein 2 n=1 Tax=Chionoecetes opilio TaxID=41210 RepID=A0A8J4Y596_CHIOP|nr:MAM and LDL-receptor class A domain-containing protein 2 [Chionoecetes opilio]